MRTLILLAAVALLPSLAYGRPILYQATATTRSELEPVIDRFRQDIGAGGINNGLTPGPLESGWREVNWDNTGTLLRDGAGINIPGSGLLMFPIVGTRLDLGGSVDVAGLGDFYDIEQSYRLEFRPYSDPNQAAVVSQGSFDSGNLTALFYTPGTTYDHIRSISGFGVVFADVDLEGAATLEFGVHGGFNTAPFKAPAAPGNGNYSFLGVRFDAGEVFTIVGIKPGNRGLWPGVVDGMLDEFGRRIDLVSIDDVIFAEPKVIPEPSTLLTLGVGLLILGPTLARLTGLACCGNRCSSRFCQKNR